MASNTQTQAKGQSTIFISGLHENVDEVEITRHIETIDKTIKVNSVFIIRDYQTYKSKGFATIEMNSNEDGT